MNFSLNSETLIIILHEIYGINRHMESVIQNFSVAGFDVICPNLIGSREPFDYEHQEVAYQHFKVNIGFERAAQQIKELVAEARGHYKHIFLCGYSIGATIGWLCSEENNLCDGIIGFYGSRIRDYIVVAPRCPVLLIFPTQEKSFDVTHFVGSFIKPNVAVHMLSGQHGFADPFSKHYCNSSFLEADRLVLSFLQGNIEPNE